MQNNNNKIIWIIGAVVLLIAGYFLLKPKEEPKIIPKTTHTETSESTHKAGIPDTTHKEGVTKTEIKYVYVDRFIKISEDEILDYKDSSMFDTTFVNDSLTIRLTGTTFPAIDSLKFDVKAIIREFYTNRVDSFFVFRTDTLQILNTIKDESFIEINNPWYNTFLAGAGTVLLIGLSIVSALVF
ncbi:hypothetical protein MASR1M107_05770 [Ignavibacteriales bacterium]